MAKMGMESQDLSAHSPEAFTAIECLARERIDIRDRDNWPAVTGALMLDLPIWTEDQDLFGSGVASWTTDRVEVYLKAS
jgi:hypothetical protein